MGRLVVLLPLLLLVAAWASGDEVYTCNGTQLLSAELLAEIRSYAPVVQSIVDYVIQGPERNRTYEELAKFVDRFGARISGSQNLENSIDYMVELLGRQGLDSVYTERVAVPHWVRGNESAWIVRPRMQRLNMLGLGGSVGTPPGGIIAPVLVVRSFQELHSNVSKVRSLTALECALGAAAWWTARTGRDWTVQAIALARALLYRVPSYSCSSLQINTAAVSM
ncbi:hypothetical protein V5799_032029 [Amblyomma americanum]|uniref:Uncharacterized protein n=1 Tax=Amblyomma americanum TaxID=6943 RepID=A0AAQ4DSC4_AMBAM